MNPEWWQTFLSGSLVMTVLGGIGWLGKYLAESRRDYTTRHATVEDQMRAFWEQQTKAEHDRLVRLEQHLESSLAEKDLQLKEVKLEVIRERAQVADCQRERAETRVEAVAARIEATNLAAQVEENVHTIADLKQQIVLQLQKIERLEHTMERRNLNAAQEPPGGTERRVEYWEGQTRREVKRDL